MRKECDGCYVWFANATPWEKSPGDLTRVIDVLRQQGWEKHPFFKQCGEGE